MASHRLNKRLGDFKQVDSLISHYYRTPHWRHSRFAVASHRLNKQQEPRSISQILGLITSKSSEKTAGTSATVALGTGLPAIPRKVAEKMLAGEYVEFSDLPPAKGKVKAIPSSMEGQIVVVQAADLLNSKKIIPDLATWLQCFALYMAIVTAKEPRRIPDLLYSIHVYDS